MAGGLALVQCCLAGVALAGPGDRAANVILFIGDGMGLEHVKAARYFKGAPLCFEDFPHTASVDTDSLGGLTDSSAAGTAIATGSRVWRGTFGDRSNGQLPSVLEYFQGKGKRTGLVTTDQMTGATPASFATHAAGRDDLAVIASNYLVDIRPDLLLGGGGRGMDPLSAQAAGYAVVTNAAELAALDPAAVTFLSGQFGEGPMAYEVDGVGDEPHLRDMTVFALAVLEQDPDGFFLMVEGANIDYASHDWRLDRMIGEALELDAAVQAALDWAGSRTDTLIFVTADHETGGMTVQANNGAGNLPSVVWTDTWHTQTPVGSWARGPGSERVRNAMLNTDSFHVMRDAALLQTYALAPPPDGPAAGPPLWAAAAGDVFRIEYADQLHPPDWQPLGLATALTDSVTVADTNAWPRGQRFYRAVALP